MAPGRSAVVEVLLPVDVAQVRIEVEIPRESFDVPIDIVARHADMSAIRTLMPGEGVTFSVPVEVGVTSYRWEATLQPVMAAKGMKPITLTPLRVFGLR